MQQYIADISQVDHISLVSVLKCCESAINVQVFLGPWSNGTTNCSQLQFQYCSGCL